MSNSRNLELGKRNVPTMVTSVPPRTEEERNEIAAQGGFKSQEQLVKLKNKADVIRN